MPSSNAGTGAATTTATSDSTHPSWQKLRGGWQVCRRRSGQGWSMTLIGPLLIVYVVWGSTYLALKVAVEHLPPLTLSAARFLIAGLILYAWCAWRRRRNPERRWRRPTAAEWRARPGAGVVLPAPGTRGARLGGPARCRVCCCRPPAPAAPPGPNRSCPPA